jgi:hypothetical protein
VRHALPQALEELASVAASGSERGGRVTGAMTGLLRRYARFVSERAPAGLAAALERTRGLSDSAPVLGALLDDAVELAVFATGYPGFVALAALDDGTLLAMGLTGAGGVDRWVRSDGVEGGRSGAGGASSESARPELVALCESVLGQPEEGVAPFFHPQATVDLAQDVAFGYSRDALGREAALARVERLFGPAVRDRIAADVSLEPELLDAWEGDDRWRALRTRIDAIAAARELDRARELCAGRLASLERFTRLPWVYVPRQARRRIDLLGAFVSLANQDLALRSEEPARASGERRAALARFAAWTDGASPP